MPRFVASLLALVCLVSLSALKVQLSRQLSAMAPETLNSGIWNLDRLAVEDDASDACISESGNLIFESLGDFCRAYSVDDCPELNRKILVGL